MGIFSRLGRKLFGGNAPVLAGDEKQSAAYEKHYNSIRSRKLFADPNQVAIPSCPPPSYSPRAIPSCKANVSVPRQFNNPSVGNKTVISSEKDPYAWLSHFHTVFVIENLEFMTRECREQVREILGVIAPICVSHDTDGIDVHFSNHAPNYKHGLRTNNSGYISIRKAKHVQQLFEVVSSTAPVCQVNYLHRILFPYMKALREPCSTGLKPINIIVLGDGRIGITTRTVISHTTRILNSLNAPRHQVGIQFFQVSDSSLGSVFRWSAGKLAKRKRARNIVYRTRGMPTTVEEIQNIVLGAVGCGFDVLPTEMMN